jgi:Mn-containing catalase
MATDSDGVPFNGSWVVGSGNIAADMYANVMTESTGRVLATRLWEMTDDPGMKDMLSFLIARDTMHQNQWLAVLEDLGPGQMPIPNSMSQDVEPEQYNYTFYATGIEPMPEPDARWVKGPSIDGKGQFSYVPRMQPAGEKPTLGPPNPMGHAQVEQVKAYDGSKDKK